MISANCRGINIITRFSILIIVVLLFTSFKEGDKIKILLIGDSTTEAGGRPVFHETIELLLAGEDCMPPAEVINLGRGGETAYSLLNSGRYKKDIAGIKNVDYIFLRYGINDWFQRQPIKKNFPADINAVIETLKMDFPEAEIILMTIIPYLKNEISEEINKLIKEAAKQHGLLLFDIFPAYKKGLDTYGYNALNIRFYPIAKIAKKYHKLLEPYTSYCTWKKADYVTLFNTELDPIFENLPEWYANRHPNSMGYRLIAMETVEFLIPVIQKNMKEKNN